MTFDLTQTDELLATTRAVRKRLDLDRPVPREVILECLRLAVQAPTGSNSQTWRWMIVDDAEKKAAIAALYRANARAYLDTAAQNMSTMGEQNARVFGSAIWLAENLEKVPTFVIPCVQGRLPDAAPHVLTASMYGSIFPAVWSFQLALRARGLGSAITTLHLPSEKQVAQLLGIPEDVMQVALLPVGYTRGTDFKRAERPPVEGITHWNSW